MRKDKLPPAKAQRDRLQRGTRGRILTLLRGPGRTVAELADALGLTGNAVRGHLVALERDGLVENREVRRGANKPSLTYGLTPAGESTFPKAHGVVMGAMLDELRARHSPENVAAFLRAVGQRLSGPRDAAGASIESRVEAAIEAFGNLGGAAQVEVMESGLALHCHDCPLADVSLAHAEPCTVVNAILGEILQVEVKTRCAREGRPSCRFEFDPDSAR
jgi:predicted ArsR family transcriptional regulator